MQLAKLIHYARRVAQLGPRKSFHVLKNRIHKKRFYRYWKHRATNKTANHEWEMIAHKHKVNKSFPLFFTQLKNSFADSFPTEIVKPLERDVELKDVADRFSENIFDLLGSGPIKFFKIPWHIDFRLQKQNQDSVDNILQLQHYLDHGH